MTDDNAMSLSRRRFLQGGAAAASALGLLPGGLRPGTPAAEAGPPPKGKLPRKPNFLVLMCDEMRFPPIYESADTKQFRQQYLQTQNLLRQNGADFHRHYAASVACTPSRASLFTGHYPSLHGATQTTGAAKEAFDPDIFWLDPNTVPTFGDYFRAAGYSTYWRGKWHASDADMLIPGTHSQLLSYDSNGVPDPSNEALYSASDRLDRYGFSGWIGPEPHGRAPLNSGSSVPAGQQGRDVGFAQQAKSLLQQLDHGGHTKPWFVVSSFVNPHDITLYGLWTNTGQTADFAFDIEEDVVPVELFDSALFDQTVNDNLATKPRAQKSYQESYAFWIQPILDDPATLERYYRYYYQLHKNVDEQMMVVLQALLQSEFTPTTRSSSSPPTTAISSDRTTGCTRSGIRPMRRPSACPSSSTTRSSSRSRCRSIRSRATSTSSRRSSDWPASIPEPIRQQLSADHSDARPLVGRNLTPLLTGQVEPTSVNDPLYFMTDDDPSRGLNQDNWTGIATNSVVQPNHLETVIARLDSGSGPKVWKYTRYFDNPQFWSEPGSPNGTSAVEDVIQLQKQDIPTTPGTYFPFAYEVTVKQTPKTDEFEMYNVTDDPMELTTSTTTRATRPSRARWRRSSSSSAPRSGSRRAAASCPGSRPVARSRARSRLMKQAHLNTTSRVLSPSQEAVDERSRALPPARCEPR